MKVHIAIPIAPHTIAVRVLYMKSAYEYNTLHHTYAYNQSPIKFVYQTISERDAWWLLWVCKAQPAHSGSTIHTLHRVRNTPESTGYYIGLYANNYTKIKVCKSNIYSHRCENITFILESWKFTFRTWFRLKRCLFFLIAAILSLSSKSSIQRRNFFSKIRLFNRNAGDVTGWKRVYINSYSFELSDAQCNSMSAFCSRWVRASCCFIRFHSFAFSRSDPRFECRQTHIHVRRLHKQIHWADAFDSVFRLETETEHRNQDKLNENRNSNNSL